MAAVPKTAGQLYDSAILKVAAEEQKKANADPLFPAAEPNPLKVFLGGYTPMISLGVVSLDAYNAGAYTSDESIEYLIIGEGGNVGKLDPSGLGKRPNTFYGAPEYYINNFEVDTIHVPDSQVGSTSATRFQFQVFEPYSMGIFYQSMQLAAIKAKYPNYQDAVFVLKIEFKGWEQPTDGYINVQSSTAPGTTRYFAITLVNSQMTFNETGSVYTVNAISAAMIPQLSTYSNVKRSITITGSSLLSIFTLSNNGLTAALNAQEKKAAKDAIVSEPDEYDIQIYTEATDILNSKFKEPSVKSSFFVKADDSFAFGRNQQAGYAGTLTFTFPATAGMTIPGIIDEVMIHSEYCINSIKNAQKDPAGYVDWYRIETRFEFKKLASTGQTAKRLIYVIVPYKAHSSVWKGPAEKFKGVSDIRQSIIRKYEYFYTGQNDDIIKWELNFDFLHFTAINVTLPGDTATNSLAVAGKVDKEVIYTANPGDDLSQLARVTGASRIMRTADAAGNAPQGGAYADDEAVKIARTFQQALRTTNDKGKIRVEMEIVGDPYYLSEAGVFLIDKTNKDAQAKRPASVKELVRSNGSMADGESEIRVFLGIRTPIDAPVPNGSFFEFPRGYSPFSGLYKILRTKNIIKDGVFTQKLTLLRDIGQDAPSANDPAINAATSNSELGLYKSSGESTTVGNAAVSSSSAVSQASDTAKTGAISQGVSNPPPPRPNPAPVERTNPPPSQGIPPD
jgi:hypothetical protein